MKKWLHSVGVYAAGTPVDRMEAPPIGWYVKLWGGGYQKSGISDLLICVNGVFLSAELKAPTGKPSDLQKMNTARINEGNGIGVVLYPDGFDGFKEIVKGVMRCNAHIPELNRLKNAHSSIKCAILTDY